MPRMTHLLLATALLAVAVPVYAQSSTSKYELTPFAAYRVGGTFNAMEGDGQVKLNESPAAGILFNINANPNGQYELMYTRQSTDAVTSGFYPDDPTIDIDIDHFQFGGTYLFEGDNVRPFLALTVGAARYDPHHVDATAETFFAASFGGGVQLAAKSRFGIRLEARATSTFVTDNSSIFCSSIDGIGSCLIQVEGNLLTQWEARAGLVFRF